MKVDVIIEGNNQSELSVAKPCENVSKHGEKDEGHVELECLGSTFGCAKAITHHLEGVLFLVLKEFPREQPRHDRNPEYQNPQPLPVILQIIAHFGA